MGALSKAQTAALFGREAILIGNEDQCRGFLAAATFYNVKQLQGEH